MATADSTVQTSWRTRHDYPSFITMQCTNVVYNRTGFLAEAALFG